MDPQRFDQLSKAVAGGVNRRQAVRAAGIGGLLAALAPWSRGQRAHAAEVKTCVYDFTAVIASGPSAAGGQPRQLAGELTIRIESSGNIEEGKLVAADGTATPVVGQAAGHAVNLRLSLEGGEIVVAVGTSQRTVRACSGEMGGPASGPRLGDVGSWTATATGSIEAAGTGASTTGGATTQTGTNATPESAAAVACNLACGGDTMGLDETACACICPAGTTSCETNVGVQYSKGGTIFFPNPNAGRTGFCADTSSDVSNCGGCKTPCQSGPSIATYDCLGGVCQYTCAPGYAQCNGDPTDPCSNDLNADGANCGVCGNACGDGYQCNIGYCQCFLACLPPQDLNADLCVCTCPGGLVACGGGCVDTSSDVNNCGACGASCGPVASVCEAGVCQPLLSQ